MSGLRTALVICLLMMVPSEGTAAAGGEGASASAARPRLFVEIVNPDSRTAIRVALDGRVIFEGVPARSSNRNLPTVPALLGPFPLVAGSRHGLVAEVPGEHAKAQLKWTTTTDGQGWIVVHYYPGREAVEQPFFTFALQRQSYKVH